MKTITSRVAVFQMVGSDYETIWDEKFDKDSGYVRLSEYTEVTFVQRERENVVTDEIAKLDDLKQEVTAEFNKKLTAIERRKQNLLAITMEPSCG